jgi:hypothetical protein
VVEAPSYEEGVGVDGSQQGNALLKKVWKGNALPKGNPFVEKDGKILLNKFKRFGGIEKNTYLCTVKNASAGLKSALNAVLRFFSAVQKLSNRTRFCAFTKRSD